MSYQSAGYGIYAPSSGLERVVQYSPLADSAPAIHYSAAAVETPVIFYSGRDHQLELYGRMESVLYNATTANPVAHDYLFTPDAFLTPNRAPQPFVGDAKEVEDVVKEAFFATTSEEFPVDMRIAVLKRDEFDRHTDNQAVMGFSINRKENGLVSDIVVRAGEKDKVLLTIGHEIGHVFSRPLANKQHEEAKAFAFSAAWMKTIKENNLAGLKNAIVLENPARNGLHDVACDFVWRMLRSGREALALYWDIVRGVV